MKIAKINLYT